MREIPGNFRRRNPKRIEEIFVRRQKFINGGRTK
jgi:hypothetical protein